MRTRWQTSTQDLSTCRGSHCVLGGRDSGRGGGGASGRGGRGKGHGKGRGRGGGKGKGKCKDVVGEPVGVGEDAVALALEDGVAEEAGGADEAPDVDEIHDPEYAGMVDAADAAWLDYGPLDAALDFFVDSSNGLIGL